MSAVMCCGHTERYFHVMLEDLSMHVVGHASFCWGWQGLPDVSLAETGQNVEAYISQSEQE